MRVVSGKYSGKRLYSPKGRKTRPTTDRVKETLFNLLENSIKINFKDQNILDIFAGSGALGIESLSRGANFCTFVDNSHIAHTNILKNINSLKIESRCALIKTDILGIPKFIKDTSNKIDIVFADPPYKKINLIVKAIKVLSNKDWLKEKVYLVVESAKKEKLQNIEGFDLLVSREVGGSSISINLSQ